MALPVKLSDLLTEPVDSDDPLVDAVRLALPVAEREAVVVDVAEAERVAVGRALAVLLRLVVPAEDEVAVAEPVSVSVLL